MNLLAGAKSLAERAEAGARQCGIAVTVTVIDTHGNLVLKHRMDGAPFHSIDLSERKAYTAAAMGFPTTELVPLVQPGERLFSMIGASGGKYVALGGGVPIHDEAGVLLGGLGISGGTTAQDIELAAAIVAGG
ncbi:MAG: heme-binding protein [Rhizobiaceae bacterium]|nr:heme-binding protein [Rhizobiaceae bacterium]